MSGSILALISIIFAWFQWVEGKLLFTPTEMACKEEIRLVQNLRFIDLKTFPEKISFHVRSYISDFDDSNANLVGFDAMRGNTEENVFAITSNPISSYRMVYRLHYLLPKIYSIANNLTEKMSDLQLPDLNAAAQRLVYLCFIHNFDVNLVADGIIFGRSLKTSLKAEHCFYIANIAEEYTYYVSIKFYEVALSRAGRDRTVDSQLVLARLVDVIRRHDRYFPGVRKLDILGTISPADPPPKQVFLFNRRIGPIRRKYGRENYLRLCLPGNRFSLWSYRQTQGFDMCSTEFIPDASANFRCWYLQDIPYWTLHPLKVEEHRRDSDLLEIHDFIRPSAYPVLEHIIQTVEISWKPKTFRSLDTFIHNAKQIHFHDANYPALKPFILDMEHISGLNVQSRNAKMESTMNFNCPGDGGQVHTDAGGKYTAYETEDNTLLTLMYFIETADVGGETAYFCENGHPCHSEARVKPKRGSVLLWHTLKKDGSFDELSMHVGCPVGLGRKILFLKWIDYKEQFGRINCGLRPGERFTLARPYTNLQCVKMK